MTEIFTSLIEIKILEAAQGYNERGNEEFREGKHLAPVPLF